MLIRPFDNQHSMPATQDQGQYTSQRFRRCQMWLTKSKCEGGDPCAHCKARGRVCVSASRGQPRQAPRTSGSGSVEAARSTDGSSARWVDIDPAMVYVLPAHVFRHQCEQLRARSPGRPTRTAVEHDATVSRDPNRVHTRSKSTRIWDSRTCS